MNVVTPVQHRIVAAKIVQFVAKDGDALHSPSADDASVDGGGDVLERVEQLQAICQQLEQVRIQAEALRNHITHEMSESERRQRFEATPLSAEAADKAPSE